MHGQNDKNADENPSLSILGVYSHCFPATESFRLLPCSRSPSDYGVSLLMSFRSRVFVHSSSPERTNPNGSAHYPIHGR